MPISCARLDRYAKRTNWKFARARKLRGDFRISFLCIGSGLTLPGASTRALLGPLVLLAWRNWQTRTAQDRMGKPVEVRVLSRAVFNVAAANLSRSRNGRQLPSPLC